jgi:hypothetical protein
MEVAVNMLFAESDDARDDEKIGSKMLEFAQ